MNNILHWGKQSTTDSALNFKLEVAGHSEPCQYCGLIHNGFCSRIKKIEYFENGTIRSVEFHDNTSFYRNNDNSSFSYGTSGYRGSG